MRDQTISSIKKLLAAKDPQLGRQGWELLQSLDDPQVVATLAEGLSIDSKGRIKIAASARGKSHLRRKDVQTLNALRVLRRSGALDTVQKLNLRDCEHLTSLAPLSGLTQLEHLNLTGCRSLTDVDALAGMDCLQELNLEAHHVGIRHERSRPSTTVLDNVDGLAKLTGLRVLSLKRQKRITNVDGLTGLTSLRRLNLS